MDISLDVLWAYSVRNKVVRQNIGKQNLYSYADLPVLIVPLQVHTFIQIIFLNLTLISKKKLRFSITYIQNDS